MQRRFPDIDATMVAFVVAGFMFLASGCLAQPQRQASLSRKESLNRFLRNYLKNPFDDYKTTRYLSAFVDLKDDGTRQVIVYFTDHCGSGGCTTLILAPEGSSYKVVTSISMARLPIRVLRTKSNGWHDISVMERGGYGGVPPFVYEEKLSFNGKSYRTSARRSVEKIPGEVVISETDEGIPLF